jgi:hypothetical protein
MGAGMITIASVGVDHYRIPLPVVLAEGMATAPERPGHGVEFDWRGLDRVRAP